MPWAQGSEILLGTNAHRFIAGVGVNMAAVGIRMRDRGNDLADFWGVLEVRGSIGSPTATSSATIASVKLFNHQHVIPITRQLDFNFYTLWLWRSDPAITKDTIVIPIWFAL
jgi:hypothetical protein